MNLADWERVIGFFVALVVSIFVCRQIARRPPRNTDSSGDKEYDKLVMSSILPRNPGISIDKVAEALKGEDLGGFSLSGGKEIQRKRGV